MLNIRYLTRNYLKQRHKPYQKQSTWNSPSLPPCMSMQKYVWRGRKYKICPFRNLHHSLKRRRNNQAWINCYYIKNVGLLAFSSILYIANIPGMVYMTQLSSFNLKYAGYQIELQQNLDNEFGLSNLQNSMHYIEPELALVQNLRALGEISHTHTHSLELFRSLLSSVLPKGDGTTDMNIKRSNDSQLGNFNASVQNMNNIHWYALFFTSKDKDLEIIK